MIMTEQEAFAYLKNVLTFGIRLGLERMQQLMALLGNPERSLRCIHIAGTNGKGSVTAFSSSILAAAGLRVGIYTSPYIQRFSERIRVLDGLDDLQALQDDETTGEIPMPRFLHLLSKVREAADCMIADGGEQPTEFELITAVAFLYYQECAVDVVVLETGLGGRLDSTNVIEKPLIVVITAIGYDHMDRLGNTIAEITAEKAGIIKRGAPVFLYDPDRACPDPDDAAMVQSVIEQRCRELQVPLTVVRSRQVKTLSLTPDGQRFQVAGLQPPLDRILQTRLLGHYQPMNAAMAIAVFRQLNSIATAGDETARVVLRITDEEIDRGVALTRWPARLELVRRCPPVLIDGAHNSQGAAALVESLRCLYPDRQLIFICGVLRDKEYQQMLRTVLGYAGVHLKRLLCVTPDNPRALPAAQLAEQAEFTIQELIHSGIRLYNDSDTVQALARLEQSATEALSLADPDADLVVVFGSLYMAGTMRSLLGGQR